MFNPILPGGGIYAPPIRLFLIVFERQVMAIWFSVTFPEIYRPTFVDDFFFEKWGLTGGRWQVLTGAQNPKFHL